MFVMSGLSLVICCLTNDKLAVINRQDFSLNIGSNIFHGLTTVKRTKEKFLNLKFKISPCRNEVD
jgi:hypothetical protein